MLNAAFSLRVVMFLCLRASFVFAVLLVIPASVLMRVARRLASQSALPRVHPRLRSLAIARLVAVSARAGNMHVAPSPHCHISHFYLNTTLHKDVAGTGAFCVRACARLFVRGFNEGLFLYLSLQERRARSRRRKPRAAALVEEESPNRV